MPNTKEEPIQRAERTASILLFPMSVRQNPDAVSAALKMAAHNVRLQQSPPTTKK